MGSLNVLMITVMTVTRSLPRANRGYHIAKVHRSKWLVFSFLKGELKIVAYWTLGTRNS
jgi:hypothetical protein